MRRWTAALLAGLLVGGGAALVLGLAAAAGLGDRLEVPARQAGDRASYDVLDGNATPVGTLRVEQLAPFPARGPDGAWRSVSALRQTLVPAGDAPEQAVEPWETGAAGDLAVRVAGGNGSHQVWVNRYTEVSVGNSGPSPNVFVAPQEVRYVGLDDAAGWCGLRHAGQGASVAPRKGLDAIGCAEAHLRLAGRGTAAGAEARVFAAAGDEVWVASGIPYPVKVVTQRPEGQRVLLLTGFEAGGGPPPSAQVPASAPPPEVQSAPRTWLGPDAGGVQHPFPLAPAIERARANPAGAGLDAFLDAHPQAQAVAASYSEHSDTQWAVRAWDVTFADGPAAFAVEIGLEQQEPGADPTAPPFWSMTSPQRDSLQVDEHGPEGRWPDPALWPARLPTVASLMRRWEAVRDPGFEGLAPTGWSFRIGCAADAGDADGACAEAEVAAGRIRFEQPPDPFLQTPVALAQAPAVEADSQVLAVDGQGTPVALRTVHRREEPTGFSLVALPGAGQPSSAVQPSPAWDLPPAGAAASGALALLAALAVAAAAAKSGGAGAGAGGAGLFSRIEAPRLLDHRGRAALVQAIEADPGIHLRALARRTGLAEGALRHHLRKLEAAGLVASRPLNGYLCWFPPAAARSAGADAMAAARSEGARRVLAAARAGTVGVRAIAAATGLAPSTVAHHLERLRAAGALPSDGSDNGVAEAG